MLPKSFVFNDQNQSNSYGFRILTSGISLKRFEKNPIMLDQHWNATQSVLGKWQNIRIENGLLLGEAVFDLEDENALKIAGKVSREFINSCSMGITFAHEDLKIIGEELVMEKCELYECSIVAVPSNANSIRLYAQNGHLLEENQIKELCLSLQQLNKVEINPKSMKKILLSAASLAALRFDASTSEVDVAAVEAALLELSNQNGVLVAKVLALEAEKEASLEKTINEMVTLAISQGKIMAPKKDDFVNLAKINFDLAKATIDAIPAKRELAAQVDNPTGIAQMTKEAFQKMTTQEQLAFRSENGAAYKKLFNVK